LLLASTSSVYGANTHMPFAEGDKADTPLTLYAATKKANEAMNHAYSHIHGVPTTVFRFFTVYDGPWGRPDMALFKFTKGILDGTPIEIYNHGDMQRDCTYVDDLVRAIRLLIDAIPPAPDARTPAHGWQPIEGDTLSPAAPWRVVNIGTASPCGCSTSSMRSRPKSAAPPSATTCPWSWATCPPLGPTPAYCSA
jgi:UDP-glucuronate 4-epimerase